MSKATTVRLKGSAWQAIAEPVGREHGESRNYDNGTARVGDAGLLLDLVVRHFEDQALTTGILRKANSAFYG